MKQEATKKSKVWLWLVIGIVLLALVGGGVAAAMLLGNDSGDQPTEEGPTGGRPEIYFNVDREDYLEADTGLSSRGAGEDGVYHIRFAIDGELKELPIADKQLVNYIDSMDVMGLTIDETGTVIDAVDIREIATEVAKDFYVQAVNGDVLTLDSSLALNGMEMNISKGELGRVFSLTEKAEFPGAEIELSTIQPMDSVTVYGNDLGEVTHIVVISHPIESPIYWRADQYYNSTTKETTRVPDENGVYTMPFFVNGERVELKCKDKALVTALDTPNKFVCHKGLVFDENGYIVDRITAASGIRGVLACELYEVIEVNGNSFTAERQISGGNEVGKQYSATIDENCKIWDVSFLEEEENRGKKLDSLQVGDRVAVFTDTLGNPVEIFVAHRLCGSKMYVNFSKQASNGETTRKPDGNGWYYIDLVVDYEVKTFRSKDKALISKIDTQNSRGVGLELDGDIITRVWGSEFVSGYGAAVGYTIDSITSIVLTMYSTTGSSTTRIMNGNCQVINISGVGGEMGTKTTPQVGDYCISIHNPAGECMYLLVIQRYLDLPVYYNLLRKYDSTKKATTRTPNEEGYYEFLMASNGKQVTVKTKSKDIASKVDSYSPGYMALKVSGGIIYEVHPSFAGTGGNAKGNGYYVKGWNPDGTLEVYSKSSGATMTLKMAKDVVVYNLSADYKDFKGEKTTTSNVKKDDMIAGLTNRYAEISVLYIRSRSVDVAPCWHVKRMYANGSTTRVPDADGYYVFEIMQNGKIVTVKTKDKLVADDLDSRSALFGMHVVNGIVKGVFGPLEVKNADAAGDINGTKFVKLSGRRLTVLKGTEKVTVTLSSSCKIFDIASAGKDFGKVTTLKEGDTIGRSYKNKDGEHTYLFVTSRFFPRVKGQTGYCEHCQQEVEWQVWSGTAFAAQDGHYYLGTHVNAATQITMGHETIDTDIVLDLNGKTLTFPDGQRGFLIYRGATLSILDSVGGGVISTGGLTNAEGLIRLANSDQRPGKLNLYGGKLMLTPLPDGSYMPMYRGGVIFLNGANTEFNMYGGEVTGGRVVTIGDKTAVGGNIYNNNGKLNIYGGKITDGKAENNKGNNIYSTGPTLIAGGQHDGGITMGGSGVLTLSGAPVISEKDGGLVIETGALIKLDQVQAGTVFPVNASGVFMKGLSNPTAVKEYFKSTKEGFSILASGDSLACGEGAYCEHCGQDVVWSKFEGNLGEGHYYLTEDSRLASNTVGKLGPDGAYGAMTTVLDLRGFALRPTSSDPAVTNYRLMMLRGETDLTVFDSSEAKTGKLIGHITTTDTGAVIRLAEKSKFTLLSGTVTLELLEGQEFNCYRGGAVLLNGASTVFNMYGGTVTGGKVVAVEGKTLMGGGNVYVRGGTFNMYGGTIEGGDSGELPGANLYVSDEMTSKVFLQGGTIDGGVYVAAGANVTIGGDIKITAENGGMDLTSGALLNIDKIDTQAAEIFVKADGIFTKPSEYFADAAEVLKAMDEAPITISKISADKVLFYGEKFVDLGSVTNDNLVFQEGTQIAYCEHCGEDVEWIALTAITADTNIEAEKHYYLAESVDNTAAYKAVGGTKVEGVEYWRTAVVHLNGNNITSTARAFNVSAFTELVVLGNGTVSGASTVEGTSLDAGRAATLHVRGRLTLLGGTYTTAENATLPTLSEAVPAGRVTLYSDVKFLKAAGAAERTMDIPGGTLEILGAYVEGDIDYVENNINGATTYQSHFFMNGGEVTGTITRSLKSAAYRFEIAGAAKIGELVLTGGQLVALTDLTADADITVVADGIFTAANEAYAAYAEAGLIKSGVTDMIVNVTDAGELEIAEPKAEITNADLVFEEGTQNAFCEHCGEIVEWTALEAITASTDLVSGKHYYLADSVENTARYTLPGGSSTAPKTAVIHMNGKNITSTELALFVSRNSELTILGNGVISGANTEFDTGLNGGRSATIHNRGKIFMHGVTVKATDATLPVISQGNPTGITEINETATVIGYMQTPAGQLIVKGTLDGSADFVTNDMDGSAAYQAHMIVENGTITGTVKIPMRAPGTSTNPIDYRFELIGTVNIGSVELEAGKVLIVDQLAADSKVGINGPVGQVFTYASENAQELLDAGVFTSLVENTMVAVVDNTLVVAEDATNKNLEFADGTATAFCQHCQQDVAWTVLPEITSDMTLVDGTHYYLNASVNNTAAYKSPTGGSGTARKTAVVHLNGNDITSTQRAFYANTYSDLFVLGNGTVTGNSELAGDLASGKAATIYCRGNVFLLGGTYTKVATNPYPVIAIGRPDDSIVVNKGATVVVPEGAANSYAIEVGAGHVEVHGATVTGDVDIMNNHMNGTLTYQRHMVLNNATINGKVYVTKTASTISGALHYYFVVTGNTKVTEMFIEKGGKVDFVDLAETADITVTGEGQFTEYENEAVADYLANGQIKAGETVNITYAGGHLTAAAK